VDTRLGKLLEGKDYDALVLAKAALERIELSAELSEQLCVGTLDPAWFVPSSSQGALVIESLEGSVVHPWLAQEFNHPDSSRCVALERGVLAALGGDCTLPIGVNAWLVGSERVKMRAVMADLSGREVRWEEEFTLRPASSADETQDLAEQFAERLLERGGDEILLALRDGGTEIP
jgi:hydroxymethylbilane synthase